MIRVLFDDQIFCAQKYGGISRYFYELTRLVGRNEFVDATIFAPLYINEYLRDGEVSIRGLHVPAIPKLTKVYQVINRALASTFERFYRPDILHQTYYRHVPRTKKTYKVITTVYDMVHEKFPESFPHRDQTAANKKRAVNSADLVICISDNTRKDLIELLGVEPDRIRTIHLGFDSSRWQSGHSHARIGRPFFLYVGERRGYKNFECLLQAYASSNQLMREYDIVALGGRRFTSEELRIIHSLRIPSGRINQVNGDDGSLKALYSQATALIYPSLYEGFGIPPLEAMRFNCPVICSNTSSIPEVVGNAGLYFDPLQPEDLRVAMEKILEVSLREQLVSLGQERVKEFSWERCAQQTIEAYEFLLGS